MDNAYRYLIMNEFYLGSPHQEIRTLVQTIKEAPKLPESYLSILPASYYATHTYVPPIKNLYTRPYHHSK